MPRKPKLETDYCHSMAIGAFEIKHPVLGPGEHVAVIDHRTQVLIPKREYMELLTAKAQMLHNAVARLYDSLPAESNNETQKRTNRPKRRPTKALVAKVVKISGARARRAKRAGKKSK